MRSPGANQSMRRGRFLFGFFTIWGALYASGAAQGGGVAFGLLALAITGAVAALWERFAFATPPRALLGALGLGRPTGRSLLAGAIVSAAVLAFYPAYTLLSGTGLTLRSDWLWLAIGLFAFHGLAEEMAWRGYSFRRLRRGRTFGAAIRRMVPLIAITHLPIVMTNGLTVGLFAIAVAAVTCIPFGYLWEQGGQTIWAAAMLHASIDAFKLFEIPGGEAGVVFSISLAIVSILLPLGVLIVGHRFFCRKTSAGTATRTSQPAKRFVLWRQIYAR